MDNISIVIPAFEAAGYITSTLQRVRESFGAGAEVIVVINDSLNKTARVVENSARKDNNIKVLDFKERLGKGRAILEGFKIAQREILGFVDADGPFDFSAIKESLNRLNSGEYDCIICSKWIGRSFVQVDQKFSRKVLSRAFNFVARNWLNLNFVDTQAGAKFIRREVFAKVGYDFICLGFDFDIELLKRLVIKGARIEEIYIPHYRNNNSTVQVFREIFSILFNLHRLKKSHFS